MPLTDYKRKRSGSASAGTVAIYRKPTAPSFKRRRMGYDRTAVGNYRRRATSFKELKEKTIDFTHNASLTANIGTPLVIVAEGAAPNERVGRKLLIRHLFVRLALQPIPSANDDALALWGRILIVHDKQANGATPNSDQVLQVLSGSELNAFQNLENGGRFKILADRRVRLGGQNLLSGNGTVDLIEHVSINLTNLNIVQEYGGTTANIVNVKSDNIILYLISDSTQQFGATKPVMQGAVVSRVRYTD